MVNYNELYSELMGVLSKICDMTKNSPSYLDEEIFNIAYIAMNKCEQEVLEDDDATTSIP